MFFANSLRRWKVTPHRKVDEVRWLIKKLKDWFMLYDLEDIKHAFLWTGNAKDRDDMEHKLKLKLLEMRK